MTETGSVPWPEALANGPNNTARTPHKYVKSIGFMFYLLFIAIDGDVARQAEGGPVQFPIR